MGIIREGMRGASMGIGVFKMGGKVVGGCSFFKVGMCLSLCYFCGGRCGGYGGVLRITRMYVQEGFLCFGLFEGFLFCTFYWFFLSLSASECILVRLC